MRRDEIRRLLLRPENSQVFELACEQEIVAKPNFTWY